MRNGDKRKEFVRRAMKKSKRGLSKVSTKLGDIFRIKKYRV